MSYVMHGRWIALFAMALLSFASQAEPAPSLPGEEGGDNECRKVRDGEGEGGVPAREQAADDHRAGHCAQADGQRDQQRR